jgi:hypothetical protein
MLTSFLGWLTDDVACRAAVITTVGGGLGVALNLWWNARQQRMTKLLSLRRDIYLESCRLTHRIATALLSMSDRDYKLATAVQMMDEFSGAAAKLHAVAQGPTVRSLVKFTNALLVDYSQLVSKKDIFERNAAEIAFIDGLLIEQAHSPSRAVTSADFEKEQEGRVDKILKYGLCKKILSDQNATVSRGITEIALSSPRRLSPLTVEFFLAVRRDLGLKIDRSWYRASAEKTVEFVDKVLSDVRNELLAAADEQARFQAQSDLTFRTDAAEAKNNDSV